MPSAVWKFPHPLPSCASRATGPWNLASQDLVAFIHAILIEVGFWVTYTIYANRENEHDGSKTQALASEKLPRASLEMLENICLRNAPSMPLTSAGGASRKDWQTAGRIWENLNDHVIFRANDRTEYPCGCV